MYCLLLWTSASQHCVPSHQQPLPLPLSSLTNTECWVCPHPVPSQCSLLCTTQVLLGRLRAEPTEQYVWQLTAWMRCFFLGKNINNRIILAFYSIFKAYAFSVMSAMCEGVQYCNLTFWFTMAMLWITEREVMKHETDLKAGKRAEGRWKALQTFQTCPCWGSIVIKREKNYV